MYVEFYRESPGKFGSRTLSRKTFARWTGRTSPALRVAASADAPFRQLRFPLRGPR